MTGQAIIVRDDARMAVSYTAEACRLRDEALESSALVGKVTDANEQLAAVAAQAKLHEISSAAEKARKACKDPVLEYGRKIDAAARDFLSEVKAEELRVARLVGDFQALEAARVRAAEQERNEKLRQIEIEKARAIQECQTHEQMDAVLERANRRAEEEAPPVSATRAPGQRVVEDWEVEVTDPWLLARAYPTCVVITGVIGEIKRLLNSGAKIPGITAKRVTRATVRLAAARPALEV